MANVTINDLPAKSGALAGTEQVEIDDGSSKSVTVGQIGDLAKLVPVRPYTTTSDTFVLADAGGAVHGANASAITQTIPTNASVAFPVGTTILVRQTGAGAITVTPDSGVTLRNGQATAKTAGQYKGSIALHKIGTDEWYLDGSVAAS
ncbi:hypothetical protein ACQKIE_00240 [Luteibacter sp. NPDC031894]|uniref:hypothetical protein n=1 Tax=Luteibacter sp. NPDC031894 TaxID=3390572 RepID=UPI003D01759D